jgi:hypothetical protein
MAVGGCPPWGSFQGPLPGGEGAALVSRRRTGQAARGRATERFGASRKRAMAS